MCALCFVLLSLVAPAGLAQPPAPSPAEPSVEVRHLRRTIIDISETTIEGVVVGPSMTAVRAGRRPRLKSLIRMRPDFREELAKTPDGL